MPDTALFLTWDKSVPGRENAGLDVVAGAFALCERLVAEGLLDSYEFGFPEPHGRPLTAFAILRGSAASISEIQAADDLQELLARASLVAQGLSVSRAVIADGIEPYLARYAAALGEVVPPTRG